MLLILRRKTVYWGFIVTSLGPFSGKEDTGMEFEQDIVILLILPVMVI